MKRYNPFYAAALPTLALPRALKRLIVLLVDASLCVIAVSLAFYLRVGEWVFARVCVCVCACVCVCKRIYVYI